MTDDIRAWWSSHKMIVTDVSAAALAMEDATAATTDAVTRFRSLTAPAVMRGFARMKAEAESWRRLVDQALALPQMPTAEADAQFRHMMTMSGKVADLYWTAASDIDMTALERAENLQRELPNESALLFEELRRVWPGDNPPTVEA